MKLPLVLKPWNIVLEAGRVEMLISLTCLMYPLVFTITHTDNVDDK